VLQAIRVFPVAAVRRPARWLDIGGTPGFGTDSAQKCGRVEGAGTDLHVIGLQQDTAPCPPELLECEYQVLECLR